MTAVPDLVLRRLFDLELSAASGLVVRGDQAWVVADDRLALISYRLADGQRATSIALDPETAGAGIELRKKIKPDLEALFEAGDGRLIALGSGSRPNRSRGFACDPAIGAVQVIDLSPLHAHLREHLGTPPNLEGAVRLGDALVLAHRGVAADDPSRILVLDAQTCLASANGEWPAAALRSIATLDLGTLDGLRLGFTDLAVHPQLGLHYLAAAERTDDAYLDGEVAGSIFGRLDAAFRPTPLARLRPDLKCEGLAWWNSVGGADHWLVVTDADDPGSSAQMLTFAVSLQGSGA